MRDLQVGRDLMGFAERAIREALADKSPGQGAAQLVQAYTMLSSDTERLAFVSVLATRVAISACRLPFIHHAHNIR
jgi:hypothetical protein